MIEKIKNAGSAFAYGVERVMNKIISPPAQGLDWLARKWLAEEVKDNESFIEFLETALAEQRLSISRYIQENKAMSERLAKYEKYGEENMIKQTEWLAKEAARFNSMLTEQIENNEKLNSSNAKMRSAGDSLAELVALNKPKKTLSKKDKQIQKAVDDWNKNSR